MKLRLLVTKKCNRSCEGCCNKDWALDELPKLDMIDVLKDKYSEIMLTGGEPMLFPLDIITMSQSLKNFSSSKIYIYTAFLEDANTLAITLGALDGITLTLHEQADVPKFISFIETLNIFYLNDDSFLEKSLRLNVFSGITLPDDLDLSYWTIKKDMEWIENCPLPIDEEFRKIQKLL